MVEIQEVRVGVQPLERFSEVVPEEQLKRVLRAAAEARQRLSKRVVWNVNSTAVGGGVAELLPSLLGYTRSVGIDSRWVVISGNEAFFRVTKRLHHALHGSPGDGTPLDEAAREVYESTLRDNALELNSVVQEGDIVILHDPQTAGLAQGLIHAGAKVVWRCHIGLDSPNEEAETGWEFLRPYLEPISRFVFSRQTYVPAFCELSEDATRTILVHTGLVEGPPPDDPDHGFVRDDGSPGRVRHRADVVRLGRPPSWDTPLVVQVSRWDPLKDMKGVMEGFAYLCDGKCAVQPELVLAGPNVSAVLDDPEGAAVFDEVEETWRHLPHAIRNRVHLASLPLHDIQENAAIVNALQHHATVVVQKSLQEGFGLTVAEAMWKGKPVVGSAVGGIQDQIEDGVSGILLKDPKDLHAFADALCSLLCEPERIESVGAAARDRVRERFLGVDHLLKYAALLEKVDSD
jgi:trehalose synthase